MLRSESDFLQLQLDLQTLLVHRLKWKALAQLIERIDPQPDDVLVPLGDFVDRGIDSKGIKFLASCTTPARATGTAAGRPFAGP